MMKIEADLHTHTVHSGHAYSTVTELAQAASNKKLSIIAITDHGPNMPGGPHEYYFGNLKVIPEKINGVKVLMGVEANILDDGKLDLEEERLLKLDLVAAGIHVDTGHNLSCKRDYTEATVKAIQNPYVDMITHPAQKNYPLDFEKVVKAAARYNVILEINASSFRKDRGDVKQSIKLCRLAQNYGVLLSLNSDAHFHTEVGDISSLQYIIRKAGLNEKDVINSSAERLLDHLYFRKKRKKEIV